MHICFASFTYPVNKDTSGVGTYVYVTARALKGLGKKVSVIKIRNKGEKEYLKDDGIDIHTISIGNLHWYISKIPLLKKILPLAIRELEYSYAMWRMVKKINKIKKIDILEGGEAGMFFLTFFKQEFPIAIKLHGELYSHYRHMPGIFLETEVILSRAIQRISFKKAKVLISPSKTYVRDFQEEVKLVEKPIYVIGNCIDPFFINEAKKSFPAELNREKIVLFVGRLELRKGIIDFLKCIPQISKCVEEAKFIVIGSYHPTIKKENIDSLLESLQISKCIQMAGFVSKEELICAYRKAAVCVFPYYYETFGIAYLEAMAFKKPLVAYRSGAAAEIIDDGRNGILVEPGDIASLSEAAVKLLNGQKLCCQMGEAGLEIARQYKPEDTGKKMLGIYNNLIMTEKPKR